MSLSVYEAELFVKSLEKFNVRDVGTDKWMSQKDKLEKLNMQAHRSAIEKHDEFVVEAFISEENVSILIHELLVIEVWKHKVMPLLMSHFSSHTSVKVYMVLYHEAVLCNLLEVLLYHDRVIRDLSDSSQNGKHSTDKADALIELVDYCYRKLTLLNIGTFKSFQEEPKPSSSKALNSTTEEEVTRHKLEMEFNTSMSSLTILRFITDHTEVIPLSITVRLLQTHDVVLSLVPLIASPPWQRYRNGSIQKFNNQKWCDVLPQNRHQLTKIEGQVWLAIFNLLMNKSCRQRYQYDSHRKDILIELRRHFSDILLDQLPLLSDLKRHIEQLAIFDPPPPSSSSVAIIEQVPEMRNSILYQRKKTQSLTSGLLRERQKKAVGPQSTLSTSSTTTKDDTPKIVVIEEVEESELKLRSSTSTQTAPSTTGEVEVAHASLHDNHKASITKDKADDDSPQERDWKAIADAAKKGAFSNDEDARQRDIRRFSENYNLDNLDDMLEMGLLGDDPICGRSGCGKIAVNRCSGCANEWYCSRKCQLKSWKKHKAICQVLSQDRKRQVEERKERETAKSLEILKELEKEKQRAEKKEKEKEQKQKVSLIEEVEEDGKLNASFNMSSLSKKKEVTPTKVGEVDTRQTLTEVSSTTENSANVQTTPAAATAKIQECLPVENIMDYINDLD